MIRHAISLQAAWNNSVSCCNGLMTAALQISELTKSESKFNEQAGESVSTSEGCVRNIYHIY